MSRTSIAERLGKVRYVNQARTDAKPDRKSVV